MKIGITCYPTAGGSGVVATELGLEMARRGHQVHFVSYAAPVRLSSYQDNVYYHSVDVSAYPLFKYPPYDIALASRMAEVIAADQLDILHVHYAIPHAICAYLAKHMLPAAGTKIITTLHGTDITLVGAERSYFGITKFAIENSDGVTAVSNYLRDKTHSIFGIHRDIEVIYNFVDTGIFQKATCADIRANFARPDEKIIMHISNMRPVKRVTDVIKAFDLIQKQVPSRLLMIGEGQDRRKAEDLAKQLEISSRIVFLGNQDDIPALLCAADIFLLPSEFETFGLAALEAMACEVPPLVTSNGGTTELIRHGEDGFLFQVGDFEGMAAKAVALLQNDDLRRTIGLHARQRVQDNFRLDILADRYEDYYRDIIQA
ncbi:N-acetyl-alpha-D-glucosaminyl L-malate synthase BshA [Planctomycetota bacterium]